MRSHWRVARQHLADKGPRHQMAMPVFLEVEDMRPAMQIQIGYDLEAADGEQVRGDVYGTAHVLRR